MPATALAIALKRPSSHVRCLQVNLARTACPIALAGAASADLLRNLEDVVQDHELVQKQGLDVTLEPGGPSVNGLQRLLDGEVEKAVGWSSRRTGSATSGG